MKNFILKSIFAFVLIIIGSSITAYAQCPPGWTYTSIAFGPDVSGCTWQVEMCHKCGLTGSDPNNLRVISIKPANPQTPCSTYSPNQDWLRAQVEALHLSLCTVPPCSLGCRDFILEFPLCVQWVTYGWQDANLDYHYSTWLEYCADGDYCQLKQKRCNDYSTNPMLQIPCPVNPGITYTLIEGTCQEPAIEMPGPPTYDFVGRLPRSECFKKYSCSAP